MFRPVHHMQRRFSRALTAVFFLCLCFFILSRPDRAHAATTTHYTRIFYYTEGTNARISFFTHADSIDLFAPQVYALTATGTLQGGLAPAVLAFARDKNVKIMPLVTNKAFSRTGVESFLDDPSAQDLAISQLVAEAQKQGYVGWQIDFEQMDSTYRDKFSAFVDQFAQAMKANGLISSVAVISETSSNPADYIKNLWQALIGVYDYSALGKSVDIVSLMTYDDSQSGGPVTRYNWLKEVLGYALANIPANKISMGIALYYWQWDTTTGKRVGIGGNEGIQNVLQKYTTKQTFSTYQQAPYLQYHAHGTDYILWFENWQSIAKKVALIKQYHLNGFSAWSLGLEVPSVWWS